MTAHALIDTVHSRPRGDWRRGIGSDEYHKENRGHFFIRREEEGAVNGYE